MNKNQQQTMNDYVLKNYHRMMKEFMYEKNYGFTKLRTCQACVYETENFFVLKSYETIVACIDKNTAQKFDFLRYVYEYTSTSAQHIAKFFRDYGDLRVSVYTYREV